eukprot:SAG22_NODE_1900_length_3339_cov_11.157716_1_plen_88_part_10
MRVLLLALLCADKTGGIHMDTQEHMCIHPGAVNVLSNASNEKMMKTSVVSCLLQVLRVLKRSITHLLHNLLTHGREFVLFSPGCHPKH